MTAFFKQVNRAKKQLPLANVKPGVVKSRRLTFGKRRNEKKQGTMQSAKDARLARISVDEDRTMITSRQERVQVARELLTGVMQEELRDAQRARENNADLEIIRDFQSNADMIDAALQKLFVVG